MFEQVFTASIALACVLCGIAEGATSSVSMSSLYGGSYGYGVDHSNYGAWYGSGYPQLQQNDAFHKVPNLYSSSSDEFSGYGMYGADYSHAGYNEAATSYQNSNMKSYGGHKVFYKGDYTNYGTDSYHSFYPKAGHSELYDLSRQNYAEGFEHPTSSINFNMKSYNSRPVYAHHSTGHINFVDSYNDIPSHYQSPHHESVHFANLGHYGQQDDFSPSDHYAEHPYTIGYNSYDNNHGGYLV